MSLFTLSDVWSYDCHESNPHTFSHKSVVIGNVDNEEALDHDGGTLPPGDLTKVVLANYAGLLRIIGTQGEPAEGTLLAELHLGAPILQIEAGYFLGIADKLDLAILHPHRLGIYTVTKLPGQIEHGSQYKVTLLYEHALKRHAFNMCYGRFGSPGGGRGGASAAAAQEGPLHAPVVIGGRRGRKTAKSGIAGAVEDALEETKRAMRHVTSSSSSGSLGKRKDFICVQSLDGTLSFFEQEVYTFSCYLPNFLLPGPLAYVQESDCFLTTSSDWELQCFKYAHLVAIGSSNPSGADGGPSAPSTGYATTAKQTQESSLGKRLVADWAYSIGEEAICDIQVLTTQGPPATERQSEGSGQASARKRERERSRPLTRIVLATFRHLYCFDVAGDLLWCKRLDFQMSSFGSYLNSSNEVITLATSIGNPTTAAEGDAGSSGVGSGGSSDPELGTFYVFNGTSLKWAARLPFSVVFVGRISVGDVPGGIALLSSRGQLAVECLGTEPSLFVAPTVESRELDYEAAEAELTQLRAVINAHAAAGEQDIATPKDSTIEVKVEFEGQNTRWLEPEAGMTPDDSQSQGQQIVALVATVKLVARVRVNDVRVTLSTPPPIVCSQESVHVGDIVGRHNYTVEFFTGSGAIPADLACTLAVFYTSDTGAPHLVHKTGIRIPLFIVARPLAVVDKSGTAKLTFGVNKGVLNLVSFYNDFEWGEESGAGAGSVSGQATGVCFQLCGGEKVAVLASTRTGPPGGGGGAGSAPDGSGSGTSRYRIQSNSIAAIHIIFNDFVQRLGRKFGRHTGSDLEISIVEPGGQLPLFEEYCAEIEDHLVKRRREIQIRDDITDRASQLRAVQRRLLVRFRDKTIGVSAPLSQLECLLDGSLEQLTDVLHIWDQNEADRKRAECKLAGATRLMLLLAQLAGKRKVDDASVGQVSSTLCAGAVPDFVQEAGWEESVFTGLSYLKTGQIASCSNLGQLDSEKLRKVIRTTLDKIRQADVSLNTPKASTGRATSSAVGGRGSRDRGGQGQGQEVLAGNEIVERMASARGKTARRRMGTAAVRSLDSIPEPEHDYDGPKPTADTELEIVNNIEQNDSDLKGQSRKKSLITVAEKENPIHSQDRASNGQAIAANNNNVDDDDSFW